MNRAVALFASDLAPRAKLPLREWLKELRPYLSPPFHRSKLAFGYPRLKGNELGHEHFAARNEDLFTSLDSLSELRKVRFFGMHRNGLLVCHTRQTNPT